MEIIKKLGLPKLDRDGFSNEWQSLRVRLPLERIIRLITWIAD